VADGLISAQRVDEMVSRLRKLTRRVLQRDDGKPSSRSERALLREAAAGGFALLRNQGALLPLAPERLHRIALIGPGFVDPCLQGGGTSWVTTVPEVGPLAAISARYEASTEILYEPGCIGRDEGIPLHRCDVRAVHERDQEGLTFEFWADGEAQPRPPELLRSSLLAWHDGIPGRVRVLTSITADSSGTHHFIVRGTAPVCLRVGGRDAVEPSPFVDQHARPWFAQCVASGNAALGAGDTIELAIEMRIESRSFQMLSFDCRPPERDDAIGRACAAAARADAVILIVGTHEDIETQGADRETTALPGLQQELARRVIAANPATVVIVNAGAPIALDWARGARALLYGWFPGEGFGGALAAVLSGDCEPGGRLPLSFAARETDYPALTTAPDGDGRLHYGESLRVGYRHFDWAEIEPEFCYGYGLGYTEFAYEALSVSDCEFTGEAMTVDVSIRNVGARSGKEVVQLYVAAPSAGVSRPPRELKAFAAVRLDASERTTVRLSLESRAFSSWDCDRAGWSAEPGVYELQVGRSSRDIRLRQTVSVGSVVGPQNAEAPAIVEDDDRRLPQDAD
jgi:beta-glucosidase